MNTIKQLCRELTYLFGYWWAWVGVFMLTFFFAWLTHVIWSIKHHEWFALIAGAIVAPVGIIHGIGIWLGVW